MVIVILTNFQSVGLTSVKFLLISAFLRVKSLVVLIQDCFRVHSIKNIIYKKVEAQIQDFYYIELRTLLNKVLRLGLEPNVLIKDIECNILTPFPKK